jgi:hypothetical protein
MIDILHQLPPHPGTESLPLEELTAYAKFRNHYVVAGSPVDDGDWFLRVLVHQLDRTPRWQFEEVRLSELQAGAQLDRWFKRLPLKLIWNGDPESDIGQDWHDWEVYWAMEAAEAALHQMRGENVCEALPLLVSAVSHVASYCQLWEPMEVGSFGVYPIVTDRDGNRVGPTITYHPDEV